MPLDATESLPLFACPDWWERIQRGEPPIADIPINEERAAKALAFFNRLRLPDVEGNPPLSEACGEWFRDIVVAFLASEDPETRERLVWELLCLVPKKSSKSTYSAALGITALYMEETPNGQMLLIGPSQNISARCFDQAQAMIRLDPDLDDIFHITDNLKSIKRRKTGTELQVKTFDTGIITGEIPLLTIIDELHELGKKPKAQKVMQQIRGGGITMNGGQVLFITTQSDERPAGIWRAELDKARKIRDGKAGPRPIMLPVLYEFPVELQKNEDYWRDQRNWPLVLPNLHKSISLARLVADYENNGATSKEAEQIWVSQHLNIEIGVGLHNDRWTGADFWQAASEPGLTLERMLTECEVITAGIDPGGQDDLLAFSLVGRITGTDRWLNWSKLWADRIVLERRKSIASILEDFEKAGDLTMVHDLEAEAYAEIAEICTRIRDLGLFPKTKKIGIDAAGGGANLAVDALEGADFDAGDDLQAISQGYKLNNIAGTVAVKLKGLSFRHAGQDIMAWCVENTRVYQRGNAQYPSKEESGAGKIDGLMSTLNASELMSWHPKAAGSGLDDFLSNPVLCV
ncbi:terminase large subunit [Palleronia caenipelagi]|uniref:Terminase large subunit n=1 Tax=Palleronia caenipelagi TaxID=2489174 RepID=A0A547Q6A7_9RHOB|nr:terminase large subunit [Palleronia caenipelagi]TRD21901.1 terminase large subunit [Palleronia caenipelagi]